jgi:predicted kinase
MALDKKSKLVIICGLPGSGKTTLARELSKKINIPCLHKDSIKESLYDIFKMKTLEDSKSIGKKSVDLLFDLTEEQLERGLDLMIEAPFNFSEDYNLFEKWQTKYNLNLYSVICSIPSKTRKDRINDRPRHRAHHDTERGNFLMNIQCNYKNIPGKQIKIITNETVEILTKAVIDQLK